MFLLLRFIPALLFIIIGTTLSIQYWNPSLYLFKIPFTYYILIFNIIVTAISTTILIQKSYLQNRNKKSISYIILYNTLPIFIVSAMSLMILFINTPTSYFFTVFLMNMGLFLYLETNFLYLYYPGKYQINSRENINDYLTITTVFLAMVSAFGFMTFLNTKTWIVILISTIFIAMLQIHAHWIHKITHKEKNLVIFISTLIVVQFIYSITLLPSSIYVNAGFVTLIYYVTQTLNFGYYNDKLTKKFITNQIIGVGILFLLLALTARWT